MGHYSIWLKHYNNCRGRILDELKSYSREVDAVKESIKEKNLIIGVDDSGVGTEGLMCFVDGGEGLQELLGATLYLIKASGLVLEKTDEKLGSERFVREVDMGLIDYDEHTKERVELLRAAMEFETALRAIEEHSPSHLFIDGSLYVCSRKRPIECIEYQVYRKRFTRLLKKCRQENIHIVGVSEDSKSRMFANFLSMKYDIKIPRFMTDSSILRMLSGNNRYQTIEFTSCSSFEAESPINSSLIASFPTVYLQPTTLSNPLRIDVPGWEKSFPAIVSLVLDLCKGSRNYGYPLPMYLAHLDAKVERKQAQWSTKQLLHHLSREEPALRDSILCRTRRESRPMH